MSRLVDALWPAVLEAAAMLGPTAFSALVGAAAGVLVALVLALLTRAAVSGWRRRALRVSSLAACGATRAEISRRTGISQDAVGLLLHARSSRRARRNLPLPARIAAPRRPENHRENRDLKLEVFAGAADGGRLPRGRHAARALPSSTTKFNRPTRSGRAA